MKKRDYIFYGVIVAFVVLFLTSAIIFKVFQIEVLPSQFYGALIGVFITAIVTAFLLRGQTEGDEKRERNIKVFEKKQEIYHAFLDKFQKIIQNGEITISAQGKNANDNNVDDLKDLLFQLGYIQMHTSENNTNEVFEKVSKIIQHMNDFNSDGADKQKSLPQFYASLSEELFGIVSIFKNDLYGTEKNTIPKNKIEHLLRECDLFIDNEEFDKYELQEYFWNELQKQLKIKGYEFKLIDFKQDVSKFYAKARGRHRWYGINFPVYTTQSNEIIHFKIEIGNDYYYGFPRPKFKNENSELVQIIQQSSNNFRPTDWWYAHKYSDRYRLDFWNFPKTEAFERLKNPRKREQLIIEVAKEIDEYIKKFIEVAKQKNL